MNEIFCAWCDIHCVELVKNKKTGKLYCPFCRFDHKIWHKYNIDFVYGIKDQRTE